MSRQPSCDFSVNVAVPDIPFIEFTLPHLIKACNYPFRRRMIVVDNKPMGKRYRNSSLGTLDQLLEVCHNLKQRGVVDEVVEIDYSAALRKKIMEKHFGKSIWQTHNHRGAPIYGYIYAYEIADSDYYLHFDSDMMLHQPEEEDWITDGIQLLEDNEDVLTVTPLPGPPMVNGALSQQDSSYCKDQRGFYRFNEFTSRRFLIKRTRFDDFLPLQPINFSVSLKRKLTSLVKRKSIMHRWEHMVSMRLQSTNYIRADLSNPKTWTMHPLARGPEFIEELPGIIQRVESGDFPEVQRGDYELNFEAWTNRKASGSSLRSTRVLYK